MFWEPWKNKITISFQRRKNQINETTKWIEWPEKLKRKIVKILNKMKN